MILKVAFSLDDSTNISWYDDCCERYIHLYHNNAFSGSDYPSSSFAAGERQGEEESRVELSDRGQPQGVVQGVSFS
ncbi:hypothetical protein BTVI_59919 [Pitangus sulphuratus]|nr:hypothetical protein BTVI_59919 [Pitangus sulphuratus]